LDTFSAKSFIDARATVVLVALWTRRANATTFVSLEIERDARSWTWIDRCRRRRRRRRRVSRLAASRDRRVKFLSRGIPLDRDDAATTRAGAPAIAVAITLSRTGYAIDRARAIRSSSTRARARTASWTPSRS
jgi:hypothetical protein